MRTLAVIFVLAVIVIAFEIYSDAAFTSSRVSRAAAPDPASLAVAHGLQPDGSSPRRMPERFAIVPARTSP
jgi:hypothetical protein